MPTSTSAAMTSEVAIGRLMKGVEMLMRVSPSPALSLRAPVPPSPR